VKLAPVVTAMAVAAVVLSAGCSGGSQSSNAGGAIPPSAHRLPGYILPSGIDSRFAGESRLSPRFFSSPVTPDRRRKKVEKEFFISDTGSNVFVFKNSTYAKIGDITSGINTSDGVWVDKKGNVYVANVEQNVTEYKKGAGSPICTYSTGLTDGINGTTDSAGNVYVADIIGDKVLEYAQCSNTVKATFSISNPEGVAVDGKGDVFVSFGGDSFEEFTNGTGTMLGATVGSNGGLVIDAKGNLIVDDQEGFIDLIKPPYTSATVLVSGLQDPFHDSLNKAENLLFNADSGSGTVTVYSYPSMTLVHTVTSSDGIDGAEGVGESPNAVF
jgi:ethanolamine utilization protein EutQ (cupin superfamily)